MGRIAGINGGDEIGCEKIDPVAERSAFSNVSGIVSTKKLEDLSKVVRILLPS